MGPLGSLWPEKANDEDQPEIAEAGPHSLDRQAGGLTKVAISQGRLFGGEISEPIAPRAAGSAMTGPTFRRNDYRPAEWTWRCATQYVPAVLILRRREEAGVQCLLACSTEVALGPWRQSTETNLTPELSEIENASRRVGFAVAIACYEEGRETCLIYWPIAIALFIKRSSTRHSHGAATRRCRRVDPRRRGPAAGPGRPRRSWRLPGLCGLVFGL
jgi:hypothetical protein